MSIDLDLKKRAASARRRRPAIARRSSTRRGNVFAELGYGATTVRDIIRATDLASGTFYNYFKSKEEVFQALQRRDGVARAAAPARRAHSRAQFRRVHLGLVPDAFSTS